MNFIIFFSFKSNKNSACKGYQIVFLVGYNFRDDVIQFVICNESDKIQTMIRIKKIMVLRYYRNVKNAWNPF